MKITVKEEFRNNGQSWGLEFPIICGKMSGWWMAWDRHSGEVKMIGTSEREVSDFSAPQNYYQNPWSYDDVS